MFCPKCATQNVDGASFCRSCGANISLIPQALTGQLPEAQDAEGGGESCFTGKRSKEVSLDSSFKNVFSGIAFLLVAIALAFSIGRGWWFWMLLPAFSLLGTGFAQYIRWREQEKKRELGLPQMTRAFSQPTSHRELPRRNTGELRAPVASVTEGTTRHLGAEAPTRHIGEETRVSKG
jgi:hypothetical protein